MCQCWRCPQSCDPRVSPVTGCPQRPVSVYVLVLAVSPQSRDPHVQLALAMPQPTCASCAVRVPRVRCHLVTHGASHATLLTIHIPPSPPCPCIPAVLPAVLALPGRARSRWEGSGECGIVARGWSHR